jgi:hypothetical protein
MLPYPPGGHYRTTATCRRAHADFIYLGDGFLRSSGKEHQRDGGQGGKEYLFIRKERRKSIWVLLRITSSFVPDAMVYWFVRQ